ncbi:MAG: hypothetical protein LC740_01230 [Actinobacteria bacterium]|nr:hypothetical protein [Actinomycetota bacterium]
MGDFGCGEYLLKKALAQHEVIGLDYVAVDDSVIVCDMAYAPLEGESLFQTEVAVANLAINTLGILSYWIRGNFWTAAVIATSVWLLGAAAIHVSEMVGAGNYNPGNAGVVFHMDIIGPLLLISLFGYSRYAGRARAGLADR